MGLVGDFFATTVLKYKVESKEAIKDIQNLSKEQKKAAKDASLALKEQGEAASTMGEKYAKGAAVIAGSYIVIKQGLADYAKESRLTAGAVGVDMGKLEAAAGGLKTRWELMAIAQAGSQGAWKLSTDHIAHVVEGMRALEKKGYDGIEVQNQLTESLKKGKLEGLDKFGLSIKTTGNQTADMNLLMRALGDAVRDVGGNFDKAGDAATRAGVKINNVRDKVGSNIGWGIDKGIGGVERAGEFAAALWSGDSSGFNGTTGAFGPDAMAVAQMMIDRRDRDAARKQSVADITGANNALSRWAKMAKAQLANEDAIAKDILAEYDATVASRKVLASRAASGAKSMDEANRTLAALGLGPPPGPGGESEAWRKTIHSENVQARIDEATARGEAEYGAGEREKWERDVAGRAAVDLQRASDEMAGKAERIAPMERMFGPISDLTAYEQGFRTLADSVRAAGDSVLNSIIANEKITGASIRKSVGAILGAKSHELWAHGLTTTLSSIYPFNPVGLASGAAQIAGAMLLGKVAGQFGGQGAAGSGGSAGRSASQDHRGGNGGTVERAGSSAVILVGGISDFDSDRYKEERIRDGMRRAGSYAPPRGAGQA